MFQRIIGSWHVVVFECAKHVDNGIDFANVGEKLVAQSFTFAGAFHQATNVHHLHRCVHNIFGLRHLGQLKKAMVGHFGHPNVWVLGGKRIRGSQGATAGECVVER